MDDEKLLEDIGRLARQTDDEERRRFGERWRRLSAGTASEEDVAALRERAEESEEARLDFEAFRPLDPDFRSRLAARWQAQTRAAEPTEPAPAPTPETFAAAPAPPGAPPVRRRRSRRRPRRGQWLAAAALLVLAVGMSWWLLSPDATRRPETVYVAELRGELRENRSPDEAIPEVPAFAVGTELRLVLRPRQPVEEGLERLFVLENDRGERRRFKPGYSVSPDGVVEVQGTVGEDLDVEPGDWTLVVFYARPGRLPDPENLDSIPRTSDSWSVVRVPFRVVGEPAGAASREQGRAPPLEIEYAGCYAMTSGPACVPRSELRLWVRASPEAAVELRIGGRIAEAADAGVDGGRRYSVAVQKGDGAVEACAPSGGSETCWSLTLAPNDQPGWYVEARRLASRGEIAAARRLLEEHRETAAPAARASASSLLARLPGVSPKDAAAYLEEAVEGHRDWGQFVELAKDTAMLVFHDLQKRDLEAAGQRLDALVLPEHAPAEAKFHLLYNRGMVRSEVGDYRNALDWLQAAADLSRRVAAPVELRLAELVLANTLRRLGRNREALALFRRLYEEEGRPCERAEVLTNYTWALILTAPSHGVDPLPLLDEALGIVASHGCSGNELKLDLLLNAALAHAEGGRTWEAQNALREAEDLAGRADSLHRLWWRDIEGRQDLREGRGGEALDKYQQMEELARQAYFPEGRWRAKVGQARAHQLLGDLDAALDSLAAADDLVDEGHFEIPLDAGREAFVAQREDGARLHLELLLRAGRAADALDVARRSRARVLRSLHHGHRLARLSAAEQTRWDAAVASYLRRRSRIEAEAAAAGRRAAGSKQRTEDRLEDLWQEARQELDRLFGVLPRQRPGEALPALRAGEIVLAYHPLPSGWVGFAADPDGVLSHRFELAADPLDSPAELSRKLLEPFGRAIRAAHKVRVLPYGELRQVEFHALPFDGEVLVAGRPVVYGLDFEVRSPQGGPGRRALVIPPDRLAGLPAARDEAVAVAETLSSLPAPWSVRFLESDEATAPRVRDLLASGFDLLHYSGHGRFGGPFGHDSSLELAGETLLTVGDILALERVPPWAVLSSCEAGTETAEAPVAGLGLAQAFLVAGARAVVAAVEPVNDLDTASLFQGFYRGWEGEADLADLLRQAQLEWRKVRPGTEWAKFRVFEP